MKFSYQWLGEHFYDPLPPAKKIAETLTARAFEVESIEEREADTIIDVKITPNRAPDCLSHRGLAREISALFGLPLKERDFSFSQNLGTESISIHVEDSTLCPLYLATPVLGVRNRESPPWLKEKILSIGERPVNLFVDIGNFVMFDIGQPIHIFDMNSISLKKIIVRPAKRGEALVTLDGKNILLRGGEAVIADEEKILGVAGVKGGKEAGVTLETKNVVIEAASFLPRAIRRASEDLGIKTEAGRRFENGLSSRLAEEGMRAVIHLLSEHGRGEGFSVGKTAKEGSVLPPQPPVRVSIQDIESKLGMSIKENFFSGTLKKLRFSLVKNVDEYEVTPPLDRLDIEKKEDVVEEIGRMYGYENLPSVSISGRVKKGIPDRRFFYGNRIRKILYKLGFSEVYTYAFGKEGEVELANPIASDKTTLRASLLPGLREALNINSYYAPLLGLNVVKIFELGRVFYKGGEHLSLAIGASGLGGNIKIVERVLLDALSNASQALNKEFPKFPLANERFQSSKEVNADELFQDLPDPDGYEPLFDSSDISYEPLSIYPFVLRDISLFVPKKIKAEEVEGSIKASAGSLLAQIKLFDEFEKDSPNGETLRSYAFRLVFQSPEKTLTDEEVGKRMARVTEALEKNENWKVR